MSARVVDRGPFGVALDIVVHLFALQRSTSLASGARPASSRPVGEVAIDGQLVGKKTTLEPLAIGGEMTAQAILSQCFAAALGVPEPSELALLGGGLIALPAASARELHQQAMNA